MAVGGWRSAVGGWRCAVRFSDTNTNTNTPQSTVYIAFWRPSPNPHMIIGEPARLAKGLQKVGKGLAKGWQRLAKGWQKVGKGWQKQPYVYRSFRKGWHEVGKRLAKGWQRLAKGWQKVGKRLAKGWQKVAIINPKPKRRVGGFRADPSNPNGPEPQRQPQQPSAKRVAYPFGSVSLHPRADVF